MRERFIALALACPVLAFGCSGLPAPHGAGVPEAGGDPILQRAVSLARPLANPADVPSPALGALARAIGDARIVMLGEPWHGDGGAIRLRGEIVRFLHDSLGFDVLAFESDFFSTTHGWETEAAVRGAAGVAADNIYPFWATTRAAAPLWEYIERQRVGSRPLDVVGLDPKHVGATARRSLPPELERRLVELTDVPAEQRRAFHSVLENYLKREQVYRPTPDELAVFFTTLEALERAMRARPAAQREPFWEQAVRNLIGAGEYAWRGASRDRVMGENLLWLATQRYPDRRIIVWAHNNHIITDKWMYYGAPDTVIQRALLGRPHARIARATYLGAEAREYFGPKVYSLGLLSHAGTFTPDIRTNVDVSTGEFEEGEFGVVKPLSPTPAGTLEAALAQAGHRTAFLDLAPFRGPEGALAARVLDYSVTPPRRMRYWEGFDGFLFIRETVGLNEPWP
ncbi:MAG: erythromycin esterase family protein [Gemmatimonadetes bacterium]|nr:erythromycin esterase family protein [Gemmatimonadota bacterium]